MQLAIPSDLQTFISQEISAGNYATEEDVVSDALRLLQAEREDTVSALRIAFQEVDDGRARPLTEAAAGLRQELGIDENA